MANPIVINAYLARFTRQEIESALDQALRNHANGVIVTDLSFEGGSSSGQITGNTENLIEIFSSCLDLLDRDEKAPMRQAFVPAIFPSGE